MNASINDKEAERNKYKGQVHGMKVFFDQMKDALAREMQISQSTSMELDALREEEDNESINNKIFPTRSNLDQRFVENEGVPTAESPTAEMEVVRTA